LHVHKGKELNMKGKLLLSRFRGTEWNCPTPEKVWAEPVRSGSN